MQDTNPQTDPLRRLQALIEGRCLWAEPLAHHTTWGCGGAAELLIVPHDAADLVRALEWCEARSVRWRVMGNGSNLLVSDSGVAGVVFKVRGTLDGLNLEGERVTAGAGLLLGRLVAAAAREGFSGLEPLVGIPGTLGGALAMNAGAHGHSLGERVVRVTFWEPGAGVRTLPKDALAFAYRDSLLKQGRRVALEAELVLSRSERGLIEARMRELMAKRRSSQPLGERSAGCVFRNPPGRFAGALIEQAGLKGERVGGAEISAKHANFILNRGRATASDIRALMELARERVRQRFGVELACEVDYWE